ncbi:MAG: SLBB domain-containing protein, partial [Fidelibacterota bacterium]
RIRRFILESYQNALVSVTLMNIRTFRLSVLGAVLHPGYVEVTPVDRVLDIIHLAGGLHKFADSDRILVKRRNGTEERISLKAYLVNGDETQNPRLLEGDKITVPFQEEMAALADRFVTPTATPVSVSGFVNSPGAYQFIYGYSVGDYIGIAGGPSEEGSLRRGILYRDQQALPLNPDEFVVPGDRIYIGENFRSRILGKSNLMTTITALTSLYLTYLSRVKK